MKLIDSRAPLATNPAAIAFRMAATRHAWSKV
jgi:hypothetical protein